MKKDIFWENSAQNRPGALCFTRRHNAASYDVTGKEARNWRKKCYVTCGILKKNEIVLWKGESCDKLIYDKAQKRMLIG